MRKTDAPASTSPRTILGVALAGPSVQTSFVREFISRTIRRTCSATARAASSAGPGPRSGSENVAGIGPSALRSASAMNSFGSSSGSSSSAPDHLREVQRPRARHDARPLVAAAAGRDPATGGGSVGERVQFLRALAIRPRREPELRERVGRVRVAAELRHEDVGTEALDGRRDHGPERLEPSVVAGVGWQRHVDRGALHPRTSPLRDRAGAREEPAGVVLVDRDREHARLVPEDRLDAVAVMDVDVDVGDSLGAFPKQPGDRDGRVVVDAEAARPGGHRVVQSAGGVERVELLPSPDGAGGLDGGACHQRAGLVHPVEDRVVPGAVAEPAPVALHPAPGGLRRLDERPSCAPGRSPRRTPARSPSTLTPGRSSSPVAAIRSQVSRTRSGRSGWPGPWS